MSESNLDDGLIDLESYTINVPFEIETTKFYSWVKLKWYHSEKLIKFPFPLGNFIDNDREFKVFPLKPWGITGVHNLKSVQIPEED